MLVIVIDELRNRLWSKAMCVTKVCVCAILEELRRRAAFFSNPPQGLSFFSHNFEYGILFRKSTAQPLLGDGPVLFPF